MSYLCIENHGVAPIECFQYFGVSTSRGNDKAIGEFGSGTKYAAALLLRSNIPISFYLGNKKYDYLSKKIAIDDGLSSKEFHAIFLSGPDGEIPLNTTLEHGVQDWTDIWMALREYVSNALDRSVRQFNDFDHLSISVTDTMEPCEGKTRIYIGYDFRVKEAADKIPNRYLHLSRKELLQVPILKGEGSSFYKKGVFVRHTHMPSLFSYNSPDLRLDESRTIDDSTILIAAARLLGNTTDNEIIGTFLNSLSQEKEYFEHKMPSWYMTPQIGVWKRCWTECYGPKAVACTIEAKDRIEDKGFNPIIVRGSWVDFLHNQGIKTTLDFIPSCIKDANEVIEDCQQLKEIVYDYFKKLERKGMTRGKVLPDIKAVVWNDVNKLGKYEDNVIYVNSELVGGGERLHMTIIEELAHHITGAGDFTREFQEFLLRLSYFFLK